MSSNFSNALRNHRYQLNRFQVSTDPISVQHLTSSLYAIQALLLIRETGLEQILNDRVKEAKLNLNYQLKDK